MCYLLTCSLHVFNNSNSEKLTFEPKFYENYFCLFYCDISIRNLGFAIGLVITDRQPNYCNSLPTHYTASITNANSVLRGQTLLLVVKVQWLIITELGYHRIFNNHNINSVYILERQWILINSIYALYQLCFCPSLKCSKTESKFLPPRVWHSKATWIHVHFIFSNGGSNFNTLL